MTSLAASELGYRTHVFCPEKDSPTSQVTNRTTVADYGDFTELDKFALQVDVVTYEFENIRADAVEQLEKRHVPVYPSSKVLRICQDRMAEKSFISSLQIETTPFQPVNTVEDLKKALKLIGTPAILKSNTMGYDGKGQVIIKAGDDLQLAFEKMQTSSPPFSQSLSTSTAILEGFVDFEKEVSVIIARNRNQEQVVYPVVENEHKHHILHKTLVPANISKEVTQIAVDIAKKIANGLDLVGILAVEMFVVKGKVLVNELAPRPHNSGHWTIEGCQTSQFEQVVRAICGLPLGSLGHVMNCEMTNLIGKDVNDWMSFLKEGNTHLHLYGKNEAREGRKMGHVTEILEK